MTSDGSRQAGVGFAAREALKKIAFRTGLVKTRYDFLIEPATILALLKALERGEHLEGDVVEIGVARGRTTVFLNRFLDNLASKKKYVIVDTFGGFVDDDIEYEKNNRNKSGYSYANFSYNDYDIWRRNVIEKNSITRAALIKSDIKKARFPVGQRFSTAFLDVDLYLPTKAALEIVLPMMVPGGTVVVDDVREGGAFDGAKQAFDEFVRQAGVRNHAYVAPDCGVIYVD